MIFNKANIQSMLVDAGIIGIDLLAGFGLMRLLDLSQQDELMIVFGWPFLLMSGLYMAGLVAGIRGIGPGMFPDIEKDSISGVLLFNSILIGVFANLALMGQQDGLLAIVGLVLFISLWFFLHKMVVRQSRSESNKPVRNMRILALVLMIPLMECMIIFTNALSSSITNVHDFKGNFVMILMMVLVTWMLSYIPRKFVKAMLGIKMTEGAFVLFLIIDYTIRVLAS